MKKLSVLFIAMIVMALVMGCGSSQKAAPAVAAPDWLDELPKNDEFWGIGFAKLQNESLARETAISRARRDVAGQLSVLVQSLLEDHAKESGTVQDSTSTQSIERVGRDLININLSGAVPNAQKRMPDGTWWVRVSIKKAEAKKDVANVFDNEAARYADFKKQEALKRLDEQLEKTQSKPTPRAED